MRPIAVAGHLCLDLAPGLGSATDLEPGRLFSVGALTVEAGGAVANTGGALTDLGVDVAAIACIGDDELGGLLVDRLRAEGFALPRLTTVPGTTTSYSLVIEKPGIDRTFWHHTGANDHFDGSTVPVDGHDLLHLGYPSLLPALLTDDGRPLHRLLARARAAGVTTSLDLAVVDRDSPTGRLDWSAILSSALSETDIISPSLDDLTSALGIDESYSPELVDRLADRLLDAGAAVVAISAGAHGLRLRTAGAERLAAGGRALAPLAEAWGDRRVTGQPHRIDRPLTTNGAGDASTAGLLYAIAYGTTAEHAVALSAACSAAVIRGERPTPAAIGRLDPTLRPLVERGDRED